MTIRRGAAWGEAGALPQEAPIASDDAQAAALLQELWPGDASLPGGTTPTIGLLGGDLHRTLGAPARDESALRAGDGRCLPMDAGTVRLDGSTPRVFVAHLVLTADHRGRLWRSRTITVCNGSFVGASYLGPRAHPNDGRLDLVDGALRRGQRRMARRRALTGSHLPHPDLAERRIGHHVIESDTPLHVWLDGEAAGTACRVEITCHPDAWIAVV